MATDQKKMEEALQTAVSEVYEKQAGRVNALLQPKFIGCNCEERTSTIAFPILEWELNRVGVMHGGAIAAAFDLAVGTLSRFYSQLNFSPTISLDTTFLKAIPFEDELHITAKIVSAGRSLTHIYAEGYLKSSGKLAATSQASYFNTDTNK